MRIAIVGGGPAGLYFAILMKKARPETAITVLERNRPDDTFGFGVVFSDATLDTFERYDLPSYERITREFAYWDDIASTSKARCIASAATASAAAPAARCSSSCAIGRRRWASTSVRDRNRDDDDLRDYDLIVAADGINSLFRQKYVEHFQPETDLRPNKFAWMGSTRPLDAFTFLFQETEWGPFIAHAYQYEPGRSTWVFETDPGTFARAGLDRMDEAQSAALMERIFGWFLEGHAIQTNRSLWRSFPMIRSKRWVRDNIVLMGDAKATAHFSIGSGTKLAMEDSIALFEALTRNADVKTGPRRI
jgi:anthraniloyl-CoA monooxygenase